jgi:hypothetical protein
MLMEDLNMHLTCSVMAARRRITQLRRQQIVTQLTPEFGSNFMSQHMKSVQNNKDEASSEHLFGGKFCESLAVRAQHLSNQALVRKDAEAVRKASQPQAKPKAKPLLKKPAAASKAQTQPKAKPAPPRATTKPAPAASSRPASSGKRPASSSKPKTAKKSRRGGKGGNS